MTQQTRSCQNVLFLDTENVGLSILAEALLDHWGAGRFAGFSGGSHPAKQLDAICVSLLAQLGLETSRLRSKSWNEFDQPSAPMMDFVFVLCDQAAEMASSSWPGARITARWSLPNPRMATGSAAERMAAYRQVFGMIERRVRILTSLRLGSLRTTEIRAAVAEINERATSFPIIPAA